MYEPDQHASTEDMEALAVQKAQELFQVCDKEQKGFINKKDMQRLQKELALDPDQLEAVFDSLDDDGNGFLTLEEFIEGFGSYLGFKSTDVKETQQEDENVYEGVDEGTDEILFKEMLNNVGASRLYDDENAIQGLWTRLRKEDGDMASNFEDFLYKVSNDIRKSKVDFETLESALKSKSLVHDEEVRKLYEEMELQIKQEKERILAEEQLKEQQIKEAMDAEMKEKDKQLQDLLLKHQEMEEKLSRLNMTESETKQENEKLQREKEDLQIMLQKSEEGLEESKSYIDQLRNVSKDEKRERARAALKVTEGIALERESLVKQLDSLRDINQQLRDDKDEAETRRIFETEARTQPSAAKRRDQLSKQGSILGNYFPASRGQPSFGESVSEDTPDVEEDDDIEVDYDDDQEGQIRSSNYNTLSNIVESRNVSYHHNGHNSESRKVSGSQGNTSEGDSDEKSPNDMSSGRSRKVRKTKRRLLPGTVAVQSRQDSLPRSSASIDSTSDGDGEISARDPDVGELDVDTQGQDDLNDSQAMYTSRQTSQLEQNKVIESNEHFVEKFENILEVKPKETLVRKPMEKSEEFGVEEKKTSDQYVETPLRKLEENMVVDSKELFIEKSEDILEVKPKETLVRKPKEKSEKFGRETKELSDQSVETSSSKLEQQQVIESKELFVEKSEDILEVKAKDTLVRKPKEKPEKEVAMMEKESSDPNLEKPGKNVEVVLTTNAIVEVNEKFQVERREGSETHVLGNLKEIGIIDSMQEPGARTIDNSEKVSEITENEILVRESKGKERDKLQKNLDEQMTESEHITEKLQGNSSEKMDVKTLQHLEEQLEESKMKEKVIVSKSSSEEDSEIDTTVELNYKYSVTDEQVDINDLVKENSVNEVTNEPGEETETHSVSSDVKVGEDIEESAAPQTVYRKPSSLEAKGEGKRVTSHTELTDRRESVEEDAGSPGEIMATVNSKAKQGSDKEELAKWIGTEGTNVTVENKDKNNIGAEETQKMAGPLDGEKHGTINQLTDLDGNDKQAPYPTLGSEEESREIRDVLGGIQKEDNPSLEESINTPGQSSITTDETALVTINQLSRETTDTSNQLSIETTDTANQLSVKTTDTANRLSEKTADTANQLSEKTANQLLENTDTANQLFVEKTVTANQITEKTTETVTQLSEKTTDTPNQVSENQTDTTNQLADVTSIRSAEKSETDVTVDNTKTRFVRLGRVGEDTTEQKDEENIPERDVRFDETHDQITKNEADLMDHSKDTSREDVQVKRGTVGAKNKQRETEIDATLREETSRKLKNGKELSLVDLQSKMDVHPDLESTDSLPLSDLDRQSKMDVHPDLESTDSLPLSDLDGLQPSDMVSKDLETSAAITDDFQTSTTVVKDLQTSAAFAREFQTDETAVNEIQTSVKVAKEIQTNVTVAKEIKTAVPADMESLSTTEVDGNLQSAQATHDLHTTVVDTTDEHSLVDVRKAMPSGSLEVADNISREITTTLNSVVDVRKAMPSGSREVADNISREVSTTLNSVVVSEGLQSTADLQSPLGVTMDLQSALDLVEVMDDKQLSVKVAGDRQFSEPKGKGPVDTKSSPSSTVADTGTNNNAVYTNLKAGLESIQVLESIETSNTPAYMDLKDALDSVPESPETDADLKDVPNKPAADLYLKTATEPEVETKNTQYTVPVESQSPGVKTNQMNDDTSINRKFNTENNSSEIIDSKILSFLEVKLPEEVLSEVDEQDKGVQGKADTGITEEEKDTTKSTDDNVSIDISIKDQQGKTGVASFQMKPDADSDTENTEDKDDTFSTTMIIYTNKFEGCDEQTRMEETREALESTVLSYPEPKYYSFMPYNKSKPLYGTLTTSGLQGHTPSGRDLSSQAMFRSPRLTAQTNGVFDGSLSSRVNSIPDHCHGKVVDRKGNKSVHFQDSDGTIYKPPHTLASPQITEESAVSRESSLQGITPKLHVIQQGQEEQKEATPDTAVVSGTKVEIMSEEKPSVVPEKTKKKSLFSSLSYILPSVPFARGIILDTWEGEEVTFRGELGDILDDDNEGANSGAPSKESPDESVTNGPRGQPVGAVESDGEAIEPVMTSQRVFKVVFVGDSGVGKSSFIHRFCNNTFNPSFSATIGVDFQVKMIQLKDTVIVLQLWDTAGQERFRSITKQYFRKADGVVIMYDVTSETSFINVRNWMTSIKENVNDNTVIEILGNKTDMTEGDDKRVVRMNDGKKLALEYEALFFECSAKSGTNVQESMAAMADLLKDKEDEEMEKALQLKDEIVEKKKCCI
ncbi:uncharacterized protein LOC110459957 isoform X2 [Mizuhopecten yessoensis]|uniref:uncharacterized protein LOC110459957 isoform X2 n=1 Tax=Mizuhopecten yessoensis TaxID=6573 RepID=UPI000B459632|nr:uncharacterized protein LOC110459957 isoform X2 [Mizuhopecten yessoensis]